MLVTVPDDHSTTAIIGRSRKLKDPLATIELRGGDQGRTVRFLADYCQMSEKSFRHRFVKTGLVSLTRFGGSDFASFDLVKGLVSDMLTGGGVPRPRGPRRRRR
jgi:hypothetical protein